DGNPITTVAGNDIAILRRANNQITYFATDEDAAITITDPGIPSRVGADIVVEDTVGVGENPGSRAACLRVHIGDANADIDIAGNNIAEVGVVSTDQVI